MACIVRGCQSAPWITKGQAFFKLPKKESLAMEWLNLCCREELAIGWNSHAYRVCDRHFINQDFKTFFPRKLLQYNSKPSRNLPTSTEDAAVTAFEHPCTSSGAAATGRHQRDLSSNYETTSQDTRVVKQESAGDNDNDDSTLCHEVKQEFVEIELTSVDGQTCAQATLTSVKVDRDVSIKDEPDDTDLDIGPTVVQPMDSCHRTNQENIIVAKNDNAIAYDGNNPVPCSVAKEESVEDNCGGVDEQQCDQARSAQVGVHVAFNGVDRGIFIKLQGTQLVIVPTVLQQRNNQSTSVVKAENTYDGNDPVLYSKVKEDSVQNKFGDAELCRPGSMNIYICDYCQKTFTDKTSIKKHLICAHAKGSYECNQCGKSFKCEQYLMLHKANVHTARMTKCNVCGTSLKPISLKHHMQRMHSDEQLQCKLCGETIKSKYYFQQHVNDHHQAKLSDLLSAGTSITGDQLDSNVTPSEQRVHSAFTSNYTYSQYYSQPHLAKPHDYNECNEESRLYECALCEKTYKSRDGLRHHVRIHHRLRPRDAEPKIFICDYCQKTFTAKLGIKDHITCVHGSGSYKCNLCDKSFGCEKYLKTHKVSMHFSRVQECNVCGKLLRRSNLKNHMFNMHSGKKLQCKVCGEIVMSKHNLHFHLNSVHGQQSTDSPILNRCEYCQKIYPGKKNLNAHLKYVHGPRCSECKACFISEARLQRHGASVHTNEEHGAIMPKSSTERVRAYREKQRAQRPPKKPPKSGLQRAREYRARQKALKSVVSVLASVDADQLPTINNHDTTAELTTSNDVSSAEPNLTVA